MLISTASMITFMHSNPTSVYVMFITSWSYCMFQLLWLACTRTKATSMSTYLKLVCANVSKVWAKIILTDKQFSHLFRRCLTIFAKTATKGSSQPALTSTVYRQYVNWKLLFYQLQKNFRTLEHTHVIFLQDKDTCFLTDTILNWYLLFCPFLLSQLDFMLRYDALSHIHNATLLF